MFQIAHCFVRLFEGWWLVCKEASPEGGRKFESSRTSENHRKSKGEMGYISKDYLKVKQNHEEIKICITNADNDNHSCHDEYSTNTDKYDVDDIELKYVAVQSYNSEDERQLCFKKDELLLVVEKSEDGKL